MTQLNTKYVNSGIVTQKADEKASSPILLTVLIRHFEPDDACMERNHPGKQTETPQEVNLKKTKLRAID